MRRFLRAMAIGGTGALGVLFACAADAVPPCVGAGDAGSRLRQEASSTPGFLLLKERLGAPLSCRGDRRGSRASVVFVFPRGGRMTLTVDTALESSAEELIVPKSAKLEWSQALATLRATERRSAAPQGCGIAWHALGRPRDTQGSTAEAEGTACHCKARLGTDGADVVRVGFSLAC